MAISSAADAVRLSKQLQKVQLELERMRKSEKAQRENLRQEVLEKLEAKAHEAQDLRAELDGVRHRLTAALNRPIAPAIDVSDAGANSSSARHTLLAVSSAAEPELEEFLAMIGCQHCQIPLMELGVSSPADLTYVTDEELGAAGLLPVQFRKIRAAANGYSGREKPVSATTQHKLSRSPSAASVPKSRRAPSNSGRAPSNSVRAPLDERAPTQAAERSPPPRRPQGSKSKPRSSAAVATPPAAGGDKQMTEMKRALQVERLAREEAEQSLLAEREVMEEMKKLQVKNTAERQRLHASAGSGAPGSTAEGVLGPVAGTGYAGHERRTPQLQHGTDTWRKLGAEIQSLESNITFIENMLLPEEEEDEADSPATAVPTPAAAALPIVHEL